jgi:hypothetical protein
MSALAHSVSMVNSGELLGTNGSARWPKDRGEAIGVAR